MFLTDPRTFLAYLAILLIVTVVNAIVVHSSTVEVTADFIKGRKARVKKYGPLDKKVSLSFVGGALGALVLYFATNSGTFDRSIDFSVPEWRGSAFAVARSSSTEEYWRQTLADDVQHIVISSAEPGQPVHRMPSDLMVTDIVAASVREPAPETRSRAGYEGSVKLRFYAWVRKGVKFVKLRRIYVNVLTVEDAPRLHGHLVMPTSRVESWAPFVGALSAESGRYVADLKIKHGKGSSDLPTLYVDASPMPIEVTIFAEDPGLYDVEVVAVCESGSGIPQRVKVVERKRLLFPMLESKPHNHEDDSGAVDVPLPSDRESPFFETSP